MLNYKEKDILEFVIKNPLASSKEIFDGMQLEYGYSTVKRVLLKLISKDLIEPKGKGKARKYSISSSYELFYPIDINKYFEKEIDERIIKADFNIGLISNVLSKVKLFTDEELNFLKDLQNQFQAKVSELSEYEYNKEFERLAIDLSWKSSQIEGNTYTLLETEYLLKEKEEAVGKSKDDAIMLLNHKEVIDFVVESNDYLMPISISRIEDVHSLLVNDLGVDRNIRKRRVGISGTNYTPLDNEFQIREALVDMCELINNKSCIFEKSLFALILLSYIQAFGDGNKRTARIVCNAILIGNEYCPISFRTIDPIEYKKALLVFYEQNNIYSFKKIFINQFEFAVKTYF